jgi:hypothetical protein
MALVRRIVLIGNDGNPLGTNVTESVQMRVYRAIHLDLGGRGSHAQDFFEFRLSRGGLLHGEAGGLRAVDPGEREFGVFHSHGIDAFESNDDPARWQGAVLLSCSGCHEFAGIHSFLSYSRARFGAGTGTPPKLIESNPDREAAVQTEWITQHHTLGLARP